MNGDPIDRQTAKCNLDIICNDSNSYSTGLADTNAGWCWAFAPFRSLLTSPAFIKSIREYKNKNCVGGKHSFNIDFLRRFFNGQEHLVDVEQCLWIIHLLCKATDRNGEITKPRLIYDLVHKIFQMNLKKTPEETFELLSVCNSIMTESLQAFRYYCVDYPFNNVPLFSQLEQKLENGEVLTLGDGKVHIFNIFKKNGVYYTLSPYNQFASCHDAIISWGRNGIGLYYLSPSRLEEMYVYDAGNLDNVLKATNIVKQQVADSLGGNNNIQRFQNKNLLEEINEIANDIRENKQAYDNGNLEDRNYELAISQLMDRMEVIKNANRNNPNIIHLAETEMDKAMRGV